MMNTTVREDKATGEIIVENRMARELTANSNLIIQQIVDVVVKKISEKFMEEKSAEVMSKINIDKIVNLIYLELAIKSKTEVEKIGK